MATGRENGRLRANDLKYRYIMLSAPETALRADTLYGGNPTRFRELVLRMEAEKRALELAENAARQKEEEARRAREKVERLKGSG